jgi:hypothetical protein
MARIPVWDLQQGLPDQGPNTLVDTNTYGIEARQQAETWKQVGKAGEKLTDVGVEFQKHMDHARQGKELNDALFAAEDQNLNLQNLVQENPDPNTWVSAYRQGMLDFKDNSLSNLADEAVQAAHTKHFDKMFFNGLRTVQRAADKQNVSIYLADVEPNLQKDADLYVQADNDLEQARIKGQAFGRLDLGVATRVLYPAKAQQLKQNWENYVTLAQANQDILSDPIGASERLGKPEENYPGMDAKTALELRGRAQAEMHRVQNENYTGYMKRILDPRSGLPNEQEIQAQVGKGLSIPQSKDILAYIEGTKANSEQKTDPQSYKEAVTRLTDQDDPLTREEFLKNVQSGDWKLDARTYGQFLVNIGSRGSKLEKAGESAFKARVNFWKTQFGMDPKGDQIMTALGQAQAAKDAGQLGNTPEEINKNLDAIFAQQQQLYMQEWGLGSFKPAPKAKQSWWGWATGGQPGSKPAQAPGGAPETVTKDGRQYRVLTIKGRRMVDPTPLP